jgi:hypothetical protein
MRRLILVVLSCLLILLITKISEFCLVCRDKVETAVPDWEIEINGYLVVDDSSLFVHKNFYFNTNNESEAAYKIDKETGKILDIIKDSAFILQSAPKELWEVGNSSNISRIFLANKKYYKKHIRRFEEKDFFLTKTKYTLRCIDNYYYSLLSETDGIPSNEFFLDDVWDYVIDNDAIYIKTLSENKKFKIKKFSFKNIDVQ